MTFWIGAVFGAFMMCIALAIAADFKRGFVRGWNRSMRDDGI